MTKPATAGAWPFRLVREVDVTGVSGTGIVAEGVEFSDGTVALRWLSANPTSVVFHDHGIASVVAVHGHDGATHIEWVAQPKPTAVDPEALAQLLFEKVRWGEQWGLAVAGAQGRPDSLEGRLVRAYRDLAATVLPLFAPPAQGAWGRCVCGDPLRLGVVHRADGPCWVPDRVVEGAQHGCTGANDCPAPAHVHGCYADTQGHCDAPEEHAQAARAMPSVALLARVIDAEAATYEPVTRMSYESLTLAEGSDMATQCAEAVLALFAAQPTVAEVREQTLLDTADEIDAGGWASDDVTFWLRANAYRIARGKTKEG